MRGAQLLLLMFVVACAAQNQQHGTHSGLTLAAEDLTLCAHKVPAATCTQCHPELAADFQNAGDWCGEHAVPESQCLICHPDLSFDPLPALPATADATKISARGEDVESLDDHAVGGKVTVFDFYADWCAPCRKITAHMYTMLRSRSDVALRKLNVVSWETPVAKRHLAKVESLPYVVVYGRDGKLVRGISGLDLEALDKAIEEGSKR